MRPKSAKHRGFVASVCGIGRTACRSLPCGSSDEMMSIALALAQTDEMLVFER